jgi:flagella basal body P-ring formation protein FlgA
VVLDAPTLSRLARAYGIDWQPRSPADQVVIGRVDGILIDSRILAEPIRAALANRGVDLDGVELAINGTNSELRLPESASLRVERLSYRPPARVFAAVLTATDGGRLLQRISVSGEIRRARAVPVLARPVARGETLVAADLRWLDADEARLPRNAVIDAEALVGLTVRRDLKPGQVILIKDLAKPVAVEKNAAVTLILSRPGIQLTARGRALADAGVGDPVQVANLQSDRVVAGIVTAPGTVTVSGEGADGLVSVPPPPAARHPHQRTVR